MQVIHDSEFGKVAIRRSPLAQNVRLKIGRDGSLSASLPHKAPLRFVTQLIDQSRDELRTVISEYAKKKLNRQNGALIGKSHTLHIKYASIDAPRSHVAHQHITVYLPLHMQPDSAVAQSYINDVVKKVLRKESQAYLPRRVHYLATLHGFSVETVRFNNAKTRWGSCSNTGCINLNVALMQLPHELIDYVIVHELCHTKHMNHSPAFWALVGSFCPQYKTLRKELRAHHPYL